MPFMQFYTTLPAHRVPQDFQRKTVEVLSRVLANKPLERITVHLLTDQNIYTGSDPDRKVGNAYAVLRSIGCVSADENRRTIDAMARHVHQELGIDQTQFRLFFIDLDPNLAAFNGKIATDHGL
ncbi:unnamed protein product [Oppiella nova]|uniref:L-dopachrome isomerase n=1 Tax=Oppiella nova TaxID=334625 RepID=A0A7R9QLW4_9ACAR|nr:unnamed protein product [Oppiella nova]CAD7651545.1 unnamed protein product [Oppiella nova]CAG2167911.1 unnamed protein product [Oppiella nova]CAG2168869.1 unnamed protein product [Oppiella nova]